MSTQHKKLTPAELADLIEKGFQYEGIIEHRASFIQPLWRDRSKSISYCMVCAVGGALIAKFNGDYIAAKKAFDREAVQHNYAGVYAWQESAIAAILNVSFELLKDVSHAHVTGKSRELICHDLRAGIYPYSEKPIEEDKYDA